MEERASQWESGKNPTKQEERRKLVNVNLNMCFTWEKLSKLCRNIKFPLVPKALSSLFIAQPEQNNEPHYS
jgi:hypothetical protein